MACSVRCLGRGSCHSCQAYLPFIGSTRGTKHLRYHSFSSCTAGVDIAMHAHKGCICSSEPSPSGAELATFASFSPDRGGSRQMQMPNSAGFGAEHVPGGAGAHRHRCCRQRALSKGLAPITASKPDCVSGFRVETSLTPYLDDRRSSSPQSRSPMSGNCCLTFRLVLTPIDLHYEAPAAEPSIRAQVVRKVTRVLPLVGVVITTLLCASPVGQVSSVLKCVRLPRPLRQQANAGSFSCLRTPPHMGRGHRSPWP